MKKTMITAIAAAMSLSFAFTAFAGEWGNDESGYWYKNDSGSYARDQILNIDGVNYGFDQNARMTEGWKQFNGKWYYFEPGTGYMATGWKQIGEGWYYLNPTAGGVMQTSWLRLGTKIYYFNEDGSMQKGNTRFYVNNFAYETDESGAVKRNTSEDKGDGRIFIYEDDGKMKYKNSTLETSNRAGGTDVYVYLLEGDLNEQIKTEAKEAIADAIEEKQDALYEEYRQKVSSVTKATKRASRRTKWEDKVRRALADLQATEAEIAEYIYEVEMGQYGRDDYEDYYYYDDDSYDDYYDDY